MERERVEGIIVGLAVGDALGYPAEFRTRSKILECLGPEGVVDFVALHDPRFVGRPYIVGSGEQPPGTFSDDTQMTVALAEGLLEAGVHVGLDALMNAVARHFVAWSVSPKNNRAPGGTCMSGCEALSRGVPWRDAGVARSKGCGSAMRVAPIGILWHDDHARLLEVARASSVLTHGHDAGIEGAAAAALAVSLAASGNDARSIYDALQEECAPRSPDFARAWERLARLWDAPAEVALSKAGIGEAWVAEEAVASALWVFANFEDDLPGGLRAAATTDGDSDSIACIAGSILGARHGIAGIPEGWRRDVEDSAYLFDLAGRLSRASEAGASFAEESERAQ